MDAQSAGERQRSSVGAEPACLACLPAALPLCRIRLGRGGSSCGNRLSSHLSSVSSLPPSLSPLSFRPGPGRLASSALLGLACPASGLVLPALSCIF